MADEDPGFSYIQWKSTTNIFYHDDNGVPRSLAWRPTRIPDPILLDEPHTLCSSSKGYTISRVGLSNYYIGNPFAADSDFHEDDGEPRHEGPLGHFLPTPHPPHHTHTVLAMFVPDPPFDDFEIFHVIRALCHWPFIYTFDEFSSVTREWVTGPARFNLCCEIVPNTGISCNRFAFWLTEYPSSVLRYNVMGDTDEELISFLELPRPILDPPARKARMQLGRVGDMLGLIIVDAAERTVELYTRGLDESQWRPPHVFDVEIKVTAATVCRLEDKTWTLFCREMPRPMRFESFKMEALIWVAGRVVMLESNADNEDEFRARVLPGEAPASIVDGLPHVCTNLIPSALDWG